MPIGGRQFALKVGFAQWYWADVQYYGPKDFCAKLDEYKETYRLKGVQKLQQIQQKLEFTKFQCRQDTIPYYDWDNCEHLETIEGKLRNTKC